MTLPADGRLNGQAHGSCGEGGGEGWSVLAEWAGPAAAFGLGLPAQQPQALTAVVPAAAFTAAGAARVKPAAAAAAAATAAAAAEGPIMMPGGVARAGGGPGGRAGCDSDWDPFHDDWHAW